MSLYALLFWLVGCMPAIKPDLQLQVPFLNNQKKIPLRIAIFVPEDSMSYNQAIRYPGPCFGDPDLLPADYGTLFLSTLEQTLKQVFEEVSTTAELSKDSNSDGILVATLKEIGYTETCPAQGAWYTMAKGEIKFLDKQMNEIWKSYIIEKKYNLETMQVLFSTLPNPAAMGEAGVKAVSALIEAWAKDILVSTEINRYARKYGPEPLGSEQIAGTAGMQRAAQIKPSIFIGYPKGDESVVEENTRLLGYVTCPNRVEKIEVYVNKQEFSLNDLWVDEPFPVNGLRGFPLDLNIPLAVGENKVLVRLLDKQGYMVQQKLAVKRLQLEDQQYGTSTVLSGLPGRMPDMPEPKMKETITSENFMMVIGDWVKQTALSDYNKGNRMYDQHRFERAAFYYNKAIKTNPLAQAYHNLGLTNKAQGQSEKAAESFSKACKMGLKESCGIH